MRHTSIRTLALLSLLLCAGSALGQGYVVIFPPPHPIPPPPPPPPRPHPIPPRPRVQQNFLRVVRERVNVTVKNNVAETSIEQVFHNDYRARIEGTYVFPLPETAALSGFAMYVNGKRMDGEVLERDKARKIYEDIVRKLRDPALLEYVGTNAFRARIFPIEPNSDQKVELKYAEPLTGDAGTFRYTLPLKAENRQSQPYDELTVKVDLQSKVPLKGVYSPTHEVDVSRDGDRKATVSFERNKAVPDKDFVLYYNVTEKDFGLSLVTHREGGDDGYFMLLIAPKQELQQDEIAGKEIVFVCDTSGSMAGDKIDQAKAALQFCLNNLNSDDRFAVVTFSTEVRAFRDALAPASEANVRDALTFVDKIKARGGTDIDSAVQTALKMVEGKEQTAMVAFVTDGLPTVGETDIAKILENAHDRNRDRRARVFAFGVGFDVNTHLLDKLGGENGGMSQYVKPKEDLEVKLSSFYEKIAYPVMSDLEVDYGGVRVHDVYPKQLPDLFKGSQLTVFGRYENTDDTRVALRGKVAGKQQQLDYEAKFRQRDENETLPRLWATRKIGHLLDTLRLKGDNKEVRDEVVRLSLEYGIVTPYTSFLIQEDEVHLARRPQVVEPRWNEPAPGAPGGRGGTLGGGFGGAAGKDGAAAMRTSPVALDAAEGEEAVSASQSVARMRESSVVVDNAGAGAREMRRVGKKLFYLTDGVWIDGDYEKDTPTLEVKYLSDAYFALTRQNNDLAKCLALGDRMIVCWNKQCLEIGPEGKETLTAEELKPFAAVLEKHAAAAPSTEPHSPAQSKRSASAVSLAAVPLGLTALGALVLGTRRWG